MASLHFPPEMQDKVMKDYVARNYQVVHVHSSQDLEGTIAEIKVNANNHHPWKNLIWKDLRKSIETALYSTAVFRLYITYQPVESSNDEGKVITQMTAVLPALVSIVSKMQNIEIALSIQIIQNRLVNTAALANLAASMESLSTQVPNLRDLSIYLQVDVSGVDDDEARQGGWIYFKSHDGPDPDDAASRTFAKLQGKISGLLHAAKSYGPCITKMFKLSVERPRYEHQNQVLTDRGSNSTVVTMPWVPDGWTPWRRRCKDGVEFQSLEDVGDALQTAINSSTEEALT